MKILLSFLLVVSLSVKADFFGDIGDWFEGASGASFFVVDLLILTVLKTGLPSTIVLSILRSENILKPSLSAFLSLTNTALHNFLPSASLLSILFLLFTLNGVCVAEIMEDYRIACKEADGRKLCKAVLVSDKNAESDGFKIFSDLRMCGVIIYKGRCCRNSCHW
jgi:hypothetical protein